MKRYVVMIRTDVDDRDFTVEALSELGLDVSIEFVSDIDELDGLVGRVGLPSVILLNDNDAIRNGYERLSQLRSKSPYSGIPIILLGEKSTREYIRKCYQAGANSFIIKPSTVAETNQKVAGFFNYWFQVAEL